MNTSARTVAGRYRLDHHIGAGAMGVVWRAHDTRLDRTVAVKELLIQPGIPEAEAEEVRARAMREGRIAARLQHPNAISVYDVALDHGMGGQDRPVPWLVMEYLPSRSLATVLAEHGTLPPREVARIGRQVAAALAVAHTAGIVHRDVKPANVLLASDGTVKITDFGISRASWDSTVTSTGVMAGTPAYFAPEVARGAPPSPAADVFSLGATLYAAVEGVPPFGLEDNPLALLHTVAAGRVRPPQQAGPLSALLMRLLREDPAERPSMVDAVHALAAVAAGSVPTLPAPVTAAAALPAAADPPTLPGGPAPETAALEPVPDPAGPLTQQMPVAAEAAEEKRRGSGRLLGISACLAVLLGALAFITVNGLGSPTGPDQAVTQQQAVVPPPPTTTTPPAPTPQQMTQTVRTYYSLLPDNPTAAWRMLSAQEQVRSGGFDTYARFWNRIDEVTIRGSLDVSGNTVVADLELDPKRGATTFERYQFVMASTAGGRVIIDSATRIGSFDPDERAAAVRGGNDSRDGDRDRSDRGSGGSSGSGGSGRGSDSDRGSSGSGSNDDRDRDSRDDRGGRDTDRDNRGPGSNRDNNGGSDSDDSGSGRGDRGDSQDSISGNR